MTIAVIGAGHWGKNHIRTLAEMGALASVAEPAPHLQNAVRERHPGVEVVPDAAHVLKGSARGVVIATPVATHYGIAKEALLAGKDVLVEKPMTMSSEEAVELVRIARENQRILMVGHLLLYQPAIQRIREYIAAGNIGEVRSLHQSRLNLGIVRSAENALWSLGVHDVAVLLSLVGEEPTSVQAFGHRVIQPQIEDEVHVHMSFKKNLRATLHLSWLWPERRRQLSIVGTEGMLVYDELAQTVTHHRKSVNPDLSIRDEGAEVVFSGSSEPLRLELEHFMARILDRGSPLSDGNQGAQVVRVLEAASRGMVGT